jgi:hypothetical protein
MKLSNKDKITEKIQKFFNTNNWIIAFGVIFVFVYLSFKIGDVLDTAKRTEKAVREDIGKVIFIASDGQIVKLKKSTVHYTDMRIANYISFLLESYLITDVVRISKGFKQTYKNEVDLVNKYTPFKEFTRFLLNKKWLIDYANNILLLISEDNFPEYIQVYDKKINSYKITDTNHFLIDINYYVIKRSYLKELTRPNKYVASKDVINIKAEGVFDIRRYGSYENPFGVKFTSIKINLLTKR